MWGMVNWMQKNFHLKYRNPRNRIVTHLSSSEVLI